MGLKKWVKPWKDVFDVNLDERLAPALYEVHLGKAHPIYADAREFFKKTHLSASMENILRDIAKTLSGRGGKNIHPLYSLFGGGKTHTLITIYHSINDPSALADINKDLAARFLKLKENARIVVLDCDSEELVPSPLRPLKTSAYKVYTIWGALAHQLGRYDDLRVEDENRVVPRVDRLKRLLGDRPIVILIDEVVKYASAFMRSGEKELRNYGFAIATFIENLARAVSDSRSVLVISLPIEVREHGQRLLFEEAYRDVVRPFFRAIGRVTTTYDVPLTLVDVVEVLKRRLFESIDKSAAVKIQNDYLGIYSTEIELFGKESISLGGKIADYYPYHPAYISILYDIVTRVPELQKTRDALKITRKVVRKLWNSEEDPDLITPCHIDLRIEEIRNLIVTPSFQMFDAVVNKDVLECTMHSSKPELAYAVATTIFLKTYVYGVAVKAEKMFPTKREVTFCTYERSLFKKYGYKVADVHDILDELFEGVLYYLQEEKGRYWFTPYVSVIEIVNEEAKRIGYIEAHDRLVSILEKLLVKNPEQLIKAKARAAPRPFIFNPSFARVLSKAEPLEIGEEREYILAVCLRSLKEDDILNILYLDSRGRTRTFKNTIAVLFPETDELVGELIELSKKLIACEKVAKELDSYYKDKDMRELQAKKLSEHRSKYVFKNLLSRSVTVFNKVAYPVERRGRDWYEETRTKAAEMALINLVEDTLSEKDVGKIAREFSFDGLKFMLSDRLGIDLSESECEIPVSELINYFYTNPRLPFTKPEILKEALKEGIRNLEIGVRRGKELYWKRVYRPGEEIPLTDTGNTPDTIRDTDIIVPWRIAAKEFIEKLLEEDNSIVREDEYKKRIYYVVRTDLGDIRLSKVKDNLELIKESIIIKNEEIIKEDIDVILSESEVTVSPGKLVEVSIEVIPIGDVSEEVTLRVDRGKIKPDKGVPPFETIWTIQAPSKIGDYTYKIEAMIRGLRKPVSRTLLIRVLKKPEIETVRGSDIVNYIGSELVGVEVHDVDSFDNLVQYWGKYFVVREGSAEISTAESNITLSFRNLEPEIMKQLIKDSREYLGFIQTRVSDFRAIMDAREPLKIEKVHTAILKTLKGVEYHVKKIEK